MRISKNHNSLGCEQPLGLDVNQSPVAQDAFRPMPGLISCTGATGSVVHVYMHVLSSSVLQLDMELEAHNLRRFQRNMADKYCIKFPTPLFFTKRVLVETFEVEVMHAACVQLRVCNVHCSLVPRLSLPHVSTGDEAMCTVNV